MSHPLGQLDSRHRAPRARRAAAFTLVELLVVISLVTLLISMLLPALGSSREHGRRAQCASGLRQLMICVTAYTNDNKERMPAFYHAWYATPAADDWLMGRDSNVLTCVGKGSVFRYGPDKGLYRCPSLETGVFTSGSGSNGGFDYALFIAFAGTNTSKIPTTALFTLNSGEKITMPVPILCEEEPAFHINSSSPEPGHCAWDQQGTWHGGGSFYASLDSSVRHFRPTGTITPAAYWSAKKPGGAFIGLDNWWGAANYDSWGRF